MLRHRLFQFLLAGVLALGAATAAMAQGDNAQVRGTVTDNTGAVVGGATVTIKSEATGFERSVTTNESGQFTLPQLRPTTYKISVTQNGFTPQEATFELSLGQVRTVDFKLEAGGGTEIINVSANADAAASIDASSNRLGVNVTAREVKELPVNGRNYSQLQLLTPGAVNTGTGNFNEIRFNGRSNQQNQTRLDGVESTAIFDASPGYLTVQGSQFRLQTSIENVQEFRVDSSNYPAEYGTGTGGQINVIGKSGGNTFHGSLFEYFRNNALDARNFFDGSQNSPLRLNQFGGSLGGRIIKDRLFFFGSFEGLRQRAGFNIIEATPSATSRLFVTGIVPGNAANQSAQWTAAATALGFNPATFTQAQFDQINNLRTLGVINAFPIGTGPEISGGGFTGTQPALQEVRRNFSSRLNENAVNFRVDGKINDRFNGYVRFNSDYGDIVAPDGTSGRNLQGRQEFFNVVASLTQLYGAGIVNETKFGVNRPRTDLRTQFSASGISGLDISSTLFNISGNIVNPGVNGGSQTGFVAPGGLTRQSSAGNGRAQPIDPISYSVIDNLSFTVGNHNLKFGGEYRRISSKFDQLGGLQFTYGSLRDFLLNTNATFSFIGDLSAPGNFSIQTNPVTTFQRPNSGLSDARQFFLIGYAQDEWRVRPNVTLSYGLRYEYYSPLREVNDRAIIYDAGRSGTNLNPLRNPRDTNLYNATKNNFAPRIGITWAPELFKGKTVIRLGGGIFYGPGQQEDLIQPIESNVYRATGSLATGITAANVQSVTSTATPVANFTPRVYDTEAYRVPERVGQYGISIQQELPGKTVLTIGYVGSQGRNLFLRNVTNTILPGTATIVDGAAIPTGVGIVNITNATGQVIAVRTIRQQTIINQRFDSATSTFVAANGQIVSPFGEMDYKTSGGTDSYNALQIGVTRRFYQGLTINGQYAWSRSIGNTQGSNDANSVQNPFNFDADRGNNIFDIRQSVNLSVLYELPFGAGRMFKLSGIANTLLGDWQIGGVYNGRSGKPIQAFISRADVVIQNPTTGEVRALPGTINATTPLPTGFVAVINTPGGSATRATRRPDLVPGVNPIASSGGLLYLNPAAFTTPRPGTYGNLGRNAIFGPSFHQFDMTFQKRFNVTERVKVEFRAEIYNLFNRANFDNPPANLPSVFNSTFQPGTPFTTSTAGATYGVINSTVGRVVGLGTQRQTQFSLRLSF
jgi:hypothetical protein